MCGIAGILNLSFPDINRNVLAAMSDAIESRGPDAQGLFVEDFVGLAHQRLSIIDLSTGDQPMTTPDGRYTIVYNGEIYNFQEIRDELKRHGISFQTQSDTEVLLKLYEFKKEKCLEDLNGMFAFAIWDKQEQSLFAARDRYGKKPFYYSELPHHFIFASELKALCEFPDFHKEIDPQAVQHFFTYEYVPDPMCIFKGVQKLPAGHYLTFHKERGLDIKRYWKPLFDDSYQIDEKEACEVFLDHLDKAIQARLISDVPLGVFLSGGIDSSALVALMARHREGKNIQTFSINFEEASFDESLYSDTIAEKFGTTHRKETLSAKRMLEILPDVARYMDEPFADASILPTKLLSAFTRQHVTVALGGDGGDEIFAGYPTFFATPIAKKFDALPGFLQGSAAALSKILPRSDKNMSLDFKLKQFLMAKGYDPVIKNQIWLSGIPPVDHPSLFQEGFYDSVKDTDTLDLVRQELTNCDSKVLGDQISYFYQKFYLCGDILTKTDRASMSHSLEVRAPFLDVNLVSFVNRLPYELKLKGVTTKYLMKKALNRTLPAMITQRSKKGFGIPTAAWLKTELKDTLLDLLNPSTLKADGIFNPDWVKTLIDEHLAGKQNHRKPLFCLLMFHLWKRNYL